MSKKLKTSRKLTTSSKKQVLTVMDEALSAQKNTLNQIRQINNFFFENKALKFIDTAHSQNLHRKNSLFQYQYQISPIQHDHKVMSNDRIPSKTTSLKQSANRLTEERSSSLGSNKKTKSKTKKKQIEFLRTSHTLEPKKKKESKQNSKNIEIKNTISGQQYYLGDNSPWNMNIKKRLKKKGGKKNGSLRKKERNGKEKEEKKIIGVRSKRQIGGYNGLEVVKERVRGQKQKNMKTRHKQKSPQKKTKGSITLRRSQKIGTSIEKNDLLYSVRSTKSKSHKKTIDLKLSYNPK